MVIFHCYVSSPEGIIYKFGFSQEKGDLTRFKHQKWDITWGCDLSEMGFEQQTWKFHREPILNGKSLG